MVRPEGLFGLDTLDVTRRQEAELEEAESQMLRVSLGWMRKDRMKNEAKLRWFGHVDLRDQDDLND